jgi:hypothetical protein
MSDFLMIAVCDADLMAGKVGEKLGSKLVCRSLVCRESICRREVESKGKY